MHSLSDIREWLGKLKSFLTPDRRQYAFFIIGMTIPLFWFAVDFDDDKSTSKQRYNLRAGAYATTAIAFLWMTEALPIAVTALLPVVMFPLLTVTTAKSISSSYFNDTIFLMLGSFIFACSMERWNLHRKLALRFLLLIGERPRAMMAGFMGITAFLSMWISNTATTSMMTPLVLAVLGQLKTKTSANGSAGSDPPGGGIAPSSQDHVHGLHDHPFSDSINGHKSNGNGIDASSAHSLIGSDHETGIEEVNSDTIPVDMELENDGNSVQSIDDRNVELDLMPDKTDPEAEQAVATEKELEDHLKFSKASLLGIAYSASIGGTATLVGTGTNVILVQTFSRLFPQAPPISFGGWFLFATPLACISLVVTFILLALMFTRNTSVHISKAHLETEHDKVGPFTWAQYVLMADLLIMVTCWFIRPILAEQKLISANYITDGTISMVAALALFVIPSRQEHPPSESKESPVHVIDGGERIALPENSMDLQTKAPRKVYRMADNETLLNVPWDIVILLGGGLALADGFQASGLSTILAHHLNVLSSLPLYLMISLICLVVLFTTELTSNIATVTLVLPILAAMAQSTHQHPLLLMIPATICCSLAFMLPVATPPNAIVFSSNILKVVDMAKAGFILNILSLLLVPTFMITVGSLIFRINFREFPAWAEPATAPA